MEDGFLEEAQKLVQFLKPKVGQPINLNRTMNVSALNALWNILVGEKMELDSPTSLKIVKLMDDFLRGGEGPAGVLTQMVSNKQFLKPSAERAMYRHGIALRAAPSNNYNYKATRFFVNKNSTFDTFIVST